MTNRRIAGVVLAGGASSRMGRPKALMPFLGQPLVARVLARLGPQVAALYLNADGPDYERFGATLVADAPDARGTGPMAGVLAALARARADGFEALATAPCDAPFLPLDLVARLSAAGGAAYAVSPSGPEPMFALWPVEGGEGFGSCPPPAGSSPRAWLERRGAAPVRFAGGEGFANVNTREEFAAAEARAMVLESPRAGGGPAPMGESP